MVHSSKFSVLSSLVLPMPPFGYWIILDGSAYTSFRGRTREELLPTLRQLQRTQPEVALRWFERGRVWENPDAAKAAALAARTAKREPRGEGWRPGGSHADPRAKYELTRDQKRARFKRNQRRERLGPPARDDRDQRDSRDRPMPRDRDARGPANADDWKNKRPFRSSRPPQARDRWPRTDRRGPRKKTGE